LAHQRARLSKVRTNSSILLASTALVASFLGEWSLDKDAGMFGWFALAALAFGIVCGVAPVWPVIDEKDPGLLSRLLSRVLPDCVVAKLNVGLVWRRGPGVGDILRMEQDGTPHAHARLAERLGACVGDNDKIIVTRSWWVVACAVLLAAQVALWIANGFASK
jgi:hypothetical protein